MPSENENSTTLHTAQCTVHIVHKTTKKNWMRKRRADDSSKLHNSIVYTFRRVHSKLSATFFEKCFCSNYRRKKRLQDWWRKIEINIQWVSLNCKNYLPQIIWPSYTMCRYFFFAEEIENFPRKYDWNNILATLECD